MPVRVVEVVFIEGIFRMQLIPVIDIRNGIAVHAVAGDRKNYQPLKSQLVTSCEPAIVLKQLASALPFQRCYVADLDAIEGRGLNRCTLAEMARTGVSMMVDAGTVNAEQTEELLDLGVDVVVIPSESLPEVVAVRELTNRFDSDQLCASIDMQQGQLLTRDAAWLHRRPEELACCFDELGFRQMIVLDLAAVGSGHGIPTLETCRMIRHLCPNMQLITGGGVHSVDCLAEAESASIDGVLVSSALHDGRLPLDQLTQKFRS